jgi:hypothetical protein
MAADDAHHQAAARAGVAEIERFARRRKRPDPGAANSPCAGPETLGDCAQGMARLAGPEHIVALEQPLNLRLAAGKKAKQKRAMRD